MFFFFCKSSIAAWYFRYPFSVFPMFFLKKIARINYKSKADSSVQLIDLTRDWLITQRINTALILISFALWNCHSQVLFLVEVFITHYHSLVLRMAPYGLLINTCDWWEFLHVENMKLALDCIDTKSFATMGNDCNHFNSFIIEITMNSFVPKSPVNSLWIHF